MPEKTGTRARIVHEFAAQLTERGYLGVSLDEIAKSVGIKKASLYHHFPAGKTEMFLEVATRYIDGSGTVLQTALGCGETLTDQLEAIVGTYAQGTYNSTLGMRIYDATRHLDDDARADVSRRYVAALISPVTDLMAEAIESGRLRKADPGFLAMAFLELAGVAEPIPEDVAMPPQHRSARPPEVTEIAREVVALFLRGAGPDRAPA